MDMLSYIEDKNLIAYCTESRDYNKINNIINNVKDSFSYYIAYDKSIIGYKIYKVENLSNIYGYNVYSINFYFTNITHEFTDYHNQKIGKLVNRLKDEMCKLKGYIIIKVPSSNSMLMNQLNKTNISFIHTGGTICYYSLKINDKRFENDELIVKVASELDKKKYCEELIKLGREAFAEYFGQYHISYVTRERAPLIYQNWVEDYLNSKDENLIIALSDDKIVGFLTFDETEYTLELVLSGINREFRSKKIYERIIRFGTAHALKKNKIATLSTQFDNYFVQRAWINIGYKPYYSFYLYHVNNTNKNNQ